MQWDLGNGDGLYEHLAGYSSDFLSTTFTVTSGIVAGVEYSFRVRAKNQWGWSDYSDILKATPSTIPDQMEKVVTQVNDTSGDVIISWTAPNDNSSPITAYLIEILDRAGTTWTEDSTNCDASSGDIFDSLTCVIPMSVFLATPYSLLQGDLIEVRASAYNHNGWSPVSSTNTEGALVRTTPTGMNDPQRNSESSDTQIILDWNPLILSDLRSGGATIISYSLEWMEQGGVTWEILTGHTVRTLATTFTVSTGLTPGQGYLFRLRAENVYGWGPYSNEVTVYAAGLPSQPTDVTTEIISTDVRIRFVAPTNDAAPITSFKILIKQSDGTFTEDTTNCNGATVQVKTDSGCDIPLTTLRASPYLLTYGDLV